MCYLLIFVHSRLFPPPTHFLSQMFPHFTTFSHMVLVQGCHPLRAGSALHLPFTSAGDGRQAVVPGEEQRQGEGDCTCWGKGAAAGRGVLGTAVPLGARGAKACKRGGRMGGGSEGRRGQMVICVLRDGAQRDVCMYAAGRWQGM